MIFSILDTHTLHWQKTDNWKTKNIYQNIKHTKKQITKSFWERIESFSRSRLAFVSFFSWTRICSLSVVAVHVCVIHAGFSVENGKRSKGEKNEEEKSIFIEKLWDSLGVLSLHTAQALHISSSFAHHRTLRRHHTFLHSNLFFYLRLCSQTI